MSVTEVREVEKRNTAVGHKRGWLLAMLVVVVAVVCGFGAWLALKVPTTEEAPEIRPSAAQTVAIYRLEPSVFDERGLSASLLAAALPGDLGPVVEAWGVRAVDPSSPIEEAWRGYVQRVALFPATVAALEGGQRDPDSFLRAAADGMYRQATGQEPDPDRFAYRQKFEDIEGVRVFQRDGGWGLFDYFWVNDGALYLYTGTRDWGDPLLATWFAHPELVDVTER